MPDHKSPWCRMYFDIAFRLQLGGFGNETNESCRDIIKGWVLEKKQGLIRTDGDNNGKISPLIINNGTYAVGLNMLYDSPNQLLEDLKTNENRLFFSKNVPGYFFIKNVGKNSIVNLIPGTGTVRQENQTTKFAGGKRKSRKNGSKKGSKNSSKRKSKRNSKKKKTSRKEN